MDIWDTVAGDRECPLRQGDRTLKVLQKLIVAWQKMEEKHMVELPKVHEISYMG